MNLAFWVLAGFAVAVAALQLATAWRFRGFYRPIDSDVPTERPPISLIVPLAGDAPGLAERLAGLLGATRPGDQLLLAVETAGDPAHALAQRLRRDHPERDVEVVLAGAAGRRMGKQHNLAAALPRASHELLAFVDDDVELEAAVLDEGARTAGPTGSSTIGGGVGAAFALPYYAGSGPLGGDLVAAYTNYAFVPNMGGVALQGAPRFIVGGFWVTTRRALAAAGGLEPHTRTVSDDAAIGRALHAAGFRNRPLRRTVRLAHEPLGAAAGARQVLKWLTLLRAEGLPLYLTVAATWNPLAWALAAGLAGWAVPSVPTALAAGVFGLVAAARTVVVLTLNGSAYRALPRARFLGVTLAYEALVAPWLFALAAFRREIVWRGRRYRIGRGGAIVDA